jgi:hypothetical protein
VLDNAQKVRRPPCPPLSAQRSNPRLTRENRWERCQREGMLVRSRTIGSRPVLVRHPTSPCAHRQASTRHVWGTRQSRQCRIPTALLRVAPAMWRLFQLSIMFVIGLMPESANDNSPLPAALIISYVAGELSPPPKASWRSEGPIRCSQSAWCHPHHAQTTALWGHQM